ncbi:MAG: hypothetical protein KDA55_23065, partial [Planctomycetales bacterium]|nr:hypothetical protein [Planctomycetales bacterium]
SDLSDLDAQAQAAAAGDPIGLQQFDGGDSVTGAYWYGMFFGGQYLHYLTNPSAMDDDLEYAFYGSVGTAVAAGGLAGGLAAWPTIAQFASMEFALPAFGISGGGLALAGGGSIGGTVIIGGGTITGTQIVAGAGILGGTALFMTVDEFIRSEINRAQSDMNNHRQGAQAFEELARDLAEQGKWMGTHG